MSHREMEPPRPQNGQERRRHRRVRTDLAVEISLADGTHRARLRDVSRAGVCFFLDRRVHEMTILRMRLDLPGEAGRTEPIEGSGVVVRCEALSPHLDHYEVAVFLNELAEPHRARLDAYVTGRG